MNINIKAIKIQLTSEIEDYIEEKINMLNKYLGDLWVGNCDVEIKFTTNHKGDIYEVGVNLEIPGEILRVEKSEEILFKAIDKVKDHLAESIKKYKGKKITAKRKNDCVVKH